MSAAASVDAIFEGFPTPSLPKNLVKPDYVAIKETLQLLKFNS